MNKIKFQGIIFSLFAIVTSIISFFWSPEDSTFYLIILATIIFFLGVPHGALDPIFAKQLLQVSTRKSWLFFVLLYGILGLLMATFWVISPLLFMIIFLILSVLHFSRDLENTTPKITKILYGGAVIVLPTLFHYSVMVHLFSLILSPNDGMIIVDFLHAIAIPYLVILFIAILFESYRNTFQALEFSSVSLLAILAQPLLSFTVFFCGMHSVRHILRTHNFSQLSWKNIFLTSLLPMLGVFLIILFGWIFLPASPNYPRILQFLFVLLACLTVPHMLLVDRVTHPHHQ